MKYHLPKYTSLQYFCSEKAKCNKVFLRHKAQHQNKPCILEVFHSLLPHETNIFPTFGKQEQIREVALMQHTADTCPVNGF